MFPRSPALREGDGFLCGMPAVGSVNRYRRTIAVQGLCCVCIYTNNEQFWKWQRRAGYATYAAERGRQEYSGKGGAGVAAQGTVRIEYADIRRTQYMLYWLSTFSFLGFCLLLLVSFLLPWCPQWWSAYACFLFSPLFYLRYFFHSRDIGACPATTECIVL